ncbi:hypothetical protein MTR67_043807 [Solanum verrucosum]|uniref:Uncharacterized protein n=1 Tax=Solanum verrucosum TaxID=315347 RepID=A0AAF0UQ29_SOLVR|nr:hypothetical protein MTR67_043807 [Solanum verrucosum]
MELLNTEVPIDLPSWIIKHMHRVLYQDENGHTLPYGFWMASIFEAFDVLVQVWDSQTVKDVFAEKEDELIAMETTHQIEKATWEVRVVALQNELAQERPANIVTVRHLNQLLSALNTTSAS